jgi:hypothetical protein
VLKSHEQVNQSGHRPNHAADDIITVTYVEPGDSPPVIIRYSLPQSREAVRHDCRS